MGRFPYYQDSREDKNPAIQLFGRRFYSDQTPVEYLAEFLLVFSSPKVREGENSMSFPFVEQKNTPLKYWSQDRLALKFFSFFASSKLETRHPVHQKAYHQALDKLNGGIHAQDDKESQFTVKLLQSLFSGFVGVAKNRTWATHAFLPVTQSLLAREVGWRHTKALRDNPKNWGDAASYFDTGSHNFMARGGELLFLQLTHLFMKNPLNVLDDIGKNNYKHLDLNEQFQTQLQTALSGTITELNNGIGRLASFIEVHLEEYQYQDTPPVAKMGWIPTNTTPEALLFATEMLNICNTSHGVLQKLELLQDLCSMQVLRSLSFQGRRLGGDRGFTPGFVGNYAWILSSPNSERMIEYRKVSQQGYRRIEDMLFRVLRNPSAYDGTMPIESEINKADAHCFKLFRKLGKDIGFIVPKTGRGMRLTLPNHLVRFFVAALIRPGKRIRLDEFYRRLFAHYGIAIASREMSKAIEWMGEASNLTGITADSSWFEDELLRGGFLIALSDAVSMVENPYQKVDIS